MYCVLKYFYWQNTLDLEWGRTEIVGKQAELRLSRTRVDVEQYTKLFE